MQFIRESDPQLGPHADLFRKHVSMFVYVYICMCVYIYMCILYMGGGRSPHKENLGESEERQHFVPAGVLC